jgi:hypothetical protein
MPSDRIPAILCKQVGIIHMNGKSEKKRLIFRAKAGFMPRQRQKSESETFRLLFDACDYSKISFEMGDRESPNRSDSS